MNILCPECQHSVPLAEGTALLRCPSCGFESPVSGLGTEPGVPSVQAVRDMSGDTVGRYRLEALLGAGGMGVVYRAVDTETEETVAVKVLNPDYQWKREAFIQRFQREVKALKRLSHPGIVRLIDSGEQGDLHYLVTDYVEGPTLAEALREGPMSVDRAVHIMDQICEALVFAHGNGIVHRDIKPANIILAPDRAMLLDFGLAQVTGGESKLTTLTRTNVAMGTFNYLSPEQRLNAKQVDHRADIFSLGVVFYEMLTGTLPLGSFAPPSQLRDEAPKKCDRIVTRSLQSSPDLRYPDAAALGDDLRRIAPAPNRSRRTLIAAAALLSLAILGGWIALRTPNAPSPQKKYQTKDGVQLNLEAQSRGVSLKSETQIQRTPPDEKEASSIQAQVSKTAPAAQEPAPPAAQDLLNTANLPAAPPPAANAAPKAAKPAPSTKRPRSKTKIKSALPLSETADAPVQTRTSKERAQPSPAPTAAAKKAAPGDTRTVDDEKVAKQRKLKKRSKTAPALEPPSTTAPRKKKSMRSSDFDETLIK